MKSFLRNTQRCLDHVFLLEQLNSYQGAKKTYAKTVVWSDHMEGHARKCVERLRVGTENSGTALQSVKSLLG